MCASGTAVVTMWCPRGGHEDGGRQRGCSREILQQVLVPNGIALSGSVGLTEKSNGFITALNSCPSSSAGLSIRINGHLGPDTMFRTLAD